MSYQARLVATLALGCVLFAAACSDSGSSGSLSPEAFVAQYTAARCDQLQPCCEQDGHPYDDQWCHESPRYGVPDPDWQFSYDEAAARECIRRMRAARDRCSGAAFTTERACFEVFRPNAELGAPCTFDSECKAPGGEQYARCLPPGPGAGSVCTIVGDPVRASAGERCGRTCSYVQDYEYCTERWGSDATCYRNDGLYCSGVTGTCEALGDEGDACFFDSFTLTCHDDLHCRRACDPVSGECASTGTCARRAGPGEECDASEYDGCVGQGRCLTVDCPASASDHEGGSSCRDVCVVPGAEGEPCADTYFSGLACSYPLFCSIENRTCERPRQLGEPCNGFESCEPGLICDPAEQRCQTLRDVGEPCSERLQCASDRCSSDPDDDPGSAATSAAAGTCLAPPRTNAWDCSEPPSPTPNAWPTPTEAL